MAKKKRRVTPKTPTVDSGYLPQSAQKLNVYTPSVLNLQKAGVYVPNQELKQVVNLLDTFGKSAKSIMSSFKGDTSANLGQFRLDASEDREHYKWLLESGEAATKEENDALSMHDEYFAMIEKSNPADAAHYMTTGLAAEILGVTQDKEGHLVPNDEVSQLEIDAYMNNFYPLASVFRNYYGKYEKEAELIHTDGVVYDLIYAPDEELKSGDALYQEALDAPHVRPDRKEIYKLGITTTAIDKATEAGMFDRAEKLLKRLPENYTGRIGIERKLTEGRREATMATLGEELSGITGDSVAAWSMTDELVEDLASAVTHIKDGDKASISMINTIDTILKEKSIPIGKKETFIRKFRNATDKNGNLLFPHASDARNRIQSLLDSLPDEYEQMRRQQARDTVERTEARQLSLAFLFDSKATIKDKDGNDVVLSTLDEMSTHLRDTYNLGNDFALELKELKNKLGGLEGDSAGNEVKYADYMKRITEGNVTARRVIQDEIFESLKKLELTVPQANTLFGMNSLETSYEDDKFSPEAMGLFDQVYNAFWRSAGAAPLTPPTASGQRILWMLPKEANPAADGDWLTLEAQLRGEWRAWIVENQTLKETDSNAYLTARTKEIIRLSSLYLATGDTSKITDYDIDADRSAHRRGGRWSPKELILDAPKDTEEENK